MQKIPKTKINYKKLPCTKQLNHRYDFKQSKTLSTNQSKIHNLGQKQIWMSLNFPSLNSVMQKNLKKYVTSNDAFHMTDFEETFGHARTRQKILLKDVCILKDQQNLSQLYSKSKSTIELKDLVQYYKYYINNPILYQKQHFKVLYNFYEKKKYLQYKKLKAVLNLEDEENSQSDNSINQNISIDAKRQTKQSTKTFYIMNLINTDLSDQSNQSESKAFLELNRNLQRIMGKVGSYTMNTPLRQNNEYLDKTHSNFKKKKVVVSNFSSNKNTVAKKSKKQSFNNSNSSLKKMKFNKNLKQSFPLKFIIEGSQLANFKLKPQADTRKKYHASNLSMGDLQGKMNNLNVYSPKKCHKKRLNSCQTAMSRDKSKQKTTIGKNRKKIIKVSSKSKFQKDQQIQLSQFQQYLKKMPTSSHKKTNQPKVSQQGQIDNQFKCKKSTSQQKLDSDRCIKKVKNKRANNNSSSKNSLQRSPVNNSKQRLIQQNILNLKRKIRLAKQSIKNGNLNSTSNLQSHKKEKSSVNLNK